MAWTTTDKYWGEKLKIVQQENETLKQQLLDKFKKEYEQEEEGGRARPRLSREHLPEQAQAENAQLKKLMISSGEGGSPGQKYKPPVTNPGRGEAVFGTGKDGQRYFEFLKAMKINPNSIMLPFSTRGNDPFDDEGNDLNTPIPNPDPTQPFDWAHGGPFYNEYGQPISDPSKGHSHNGVPLPQIEHLKQTPEEMLENERIHNQNYPDPSHGLMISDHRGLTNYLDSKGRSGRTGSFKDSGLSQDKLIEALKIGLQVMKA